MSRPCVDCGALGRGYRCQPCWRIYHADDRTREFTLPPRLPEPESLSVCACGALRDLVTFGGVTRCQSCWRGGVPRNLRGT